MTNIPTIDLHDGAKIPQLGVGVFKVKPEDTERVVSDALEIGYRHIDTARIYGNEEGVGRAIASSGIPREELFVTTKLWNDDHGAEKARPAAEASLERLGLDHVDLYLIHWPAPANGLALPTWEEMLKIREAGLATSVGVCNFLPEHLTPLLDEFDDVPVVDQIEQHPYLQQPELRTLLESKGIRTEAWAPIGQAKPELLAEPAVVAAAEAHGKTAAQAILRWHVQRGTIIFPKSNHRERLQENFELFDFELTDAEMAAITALDKGESGRLFTHPRDLN
ncbi:2,5-diketo-D-gluconic acid reductase A [Pseudoclavibacter triregionum]|nr:2,5-diketo-D-gluconic acid reductase A [Pseudoclavibacter triregionum]